jgi:phosphate-selective porin OprO/OprP
MGAFALAAALVAPPCARGEDFLVLAETDSAPALALPTVTASLDSFDAVADALERENRRVAALEARLASLEKNAVEPLPLPRPAEKTAAGAAGDKPADGKADAGKDTKKDDKKPAEDPYEVGTDLNMPTKWNYGLEGNSGHKDFRVKVGGRVQFDNVAFSQGDGPAQKPSNGGLTPPLTNATDFRRARFRIDGRMYELFDFASEFDFVNQLNSNSLVAPTEAGLGNYPAVTENWLQIREVPLLGVVRGGNQKDPFGFEHMTSSRFLNFMERSYAQDLYEGPFNNGFIPGLRIINSAYDQRLTWSGGIFKQNANPFGYANTGRANSLVGRLTWLPIYEDEGKKLLHLGIAGRAQQTNVRDEVRLRARGDLRNGPPGPLNSIYLDTGLLNATWQNQIGLELVGNNGPWSFQSEYFGNWLYNTTSNTGAFSPTSSFAGVPGFTNPNYGTAGLQPKGAFCGTYFTNSGYAEVLYFLTGESRAYDKFDARFDRVIPRNNFYVLRDANGRTVSSEGALQLGLRYQYACLSDHQINGGTLNALTLGLNWFFNPNSKLQFNYDFAYRDFTNNFNKNASGWITGFGTRLAFDF